MALQLKSPISKKTLGKSGGVNTDWPVIRVIMPVLEFAMPLIRHLPVVQRLKILGAAAVMYFLAVAVVVSMNNLEVARGSRYAAESGNLQVSLHKMTRDIKLGLSGSSKGFDDLQQSKEEIRSIIDALNKGDANLPATTGAAREPLNALMNVTDDLLSNVDKMQKGRDDLLAMANAIIAVGKLNVEFRGPLQKMIDSYSGEKKMVAVKLTLAVEQIAKDSDKMLNGKITLEQLAQLGISTYSAEEALAMLPPEDPLVREAANLFVPYQTSVETLVGRANNLVETNALAILIQRDIETALDKVEVLVAAYRNPFMVRITSIAAPILALLLLWDLLLLVKEFIDDSVRRSREAERINRENQNAILRLMNELSDLADGDLTARATVSEDITGAIADSINYTTDELRKLVDRVNTASQQVTKATSDAGTVTKGLLAATQKQAAEIRDAGGAVDLMARSIQEVDSSAAQSSKVARRTLEVTEQGAQAVRNSVAGMDGIREQIQETSKRIKRLGESSQEIGEIVDLISDITEQTNVLALNAAIQAASAGEAGRGFAVVAEEVQRLAERSGEATKQIGLLVKTIQGDTQDAVVAMEKSTQGVVEGAKLSDEAGKSLQEIERSTRELTDLVNSISVSTQVQNDMAREVSSIMADILKITEQTSKGTQLTSASVAQLESLASELDGSVSGFKL
ncbi:MAG: methyl-accepting chemotaxis protein [Sideroxydans sp.]|nr:methyl-accepting chemotaxis protein [Sideroxydans sp.]